MSDSTLPRKVAAADAQFSPVPRLTHSAVLVHDIEICSDDEVDLVITNYEEEINRRVHLAT